MNQDLPIGLRATHSTLKKDWTESTPIDLSKATHKRFDSLAEVEFLPEKMLVETAMRVVTDKDGSPIRAYCVNSRDRYKLHLNTEGHIESVYAVSHSTYEPNSNKQFKIRATLKDSKIRYIEEISDFKSIEWYNSHKKRWISIDLEELKLKKDDAPGISNAAFSMAFDSFYMGQNTLIDAKKIEP